jgi:hypothetical protein
MRYFTASILIVCLAIPNKTLAQGADNSKRQWSAVTLLQVGSKLEIQLKDGQKAKGTLVETSETGLTLSDRTGARHINGTDVLKLYSVGRRTLGRTAAIGAGVGAGSGVAIGVTAALTTGCGDHGGACIEGPIFLAVAGIMIGAITGLALGIIRQKRFLIYESP